MGKVTGFLEIDRRDRRYAPAGDRFSSSLTVAATTILTLLSSDGALACRNARYWSTGADLGKLKPGEIVVKARLIDSYKGERYVGSIMGMPYGMIYYVRISSIVGRAPGAAEEFRGDGTATIYVRLPPFPCEQYVPVNFGNAEKVLVLKKGETGLYDLVGGQE